MATCIVQNGGALAVGQPTSASDASACLGYLLTQGELNATVGPPDYAALGVDSVSLGAAFSWGAGVIFMGFLMAYGVQIGMRFIRMIGR